MSGFIAAESVESLEFDFRPWVQSNGTIPEPSSKKVSEFMKTLSNIYRAEYERARKASRTEAEPKGRTKKTKQEVDSEAIQRMMEEIDGDVQEQASERLFEAISEVCSGVVTVEDLTGLPFRIVRSFSGWLVGELQNPEGSTPATKK